MEIDYVQEIKNLDELLLEIEVKRRIATKELVAELNKFSGPTLKDFFEEPVLEIGPLDLAKITWGPEPVKTITLKEMEERTAIVNRFMKHFNIKLKKC